jgi:hypothetical protein
MIIGYSITYIDCEDTIKEILWKKRYMWKTWQNTIDAAYELINVIKEQYTFTYSLANINENNCDEKGEIFCTFYHDKEKNDESSYIIIWPIYQTLQ